ncbi:hypothetical protein [Deinococcus sp. UYEF24]
MASRPSMGRSAFLHRFLLRTARDKSLFSPALSTEQVVLHLIAMQNGVSLNDLKRRQLHRPDSHAVSDVINAMCGETLSFFSDAAFGTVTAHLRELAGAPAPETVLMPRLFVINDLKTLIFPRRARRGAALSVLHPETVIHPDDPQRQSHSRAAPKTRIWSSSVTGRSPSSKAWATSSQSNKSRCAQASAPACTACATSGSFPR